MSESFAELFEESLKTVDMEPGSIVTGVVIDIDNEWVTVHAGLKSEGVIPLDQFINANGECTLNVGDEGEAVDVSQALGTLARCVPGPSRSPPKLSALSRAALASASHHHRAGRAGLRPNSSADEGTSVP